MRYNKKQRVRLDNWEKTMQTVMLNGARRINKETSAQDDDGRDCCALFQFVVHDGPS